MSDSDGFGDGKSKPISEVLSKLKKKSKGKRKVTLATASSMLNYFDGNNITKKSCESAGPDGTTVDKVVTTETWSTANPGHKPDP